MKPCVDNVGAHHRPIWPVSGHTLARDARVRESASLSIAPGSTRGCARWVSHGCMRSLARRASARRGGPCPELRWLGLCRGALGLKTSPPPFMF